jgi:hypothetical protein
MTGKTMPNLQDLINLAKADGGKFFVIDESGEIKLVILPFEDYQRLHGRKSENEEADPETINRAITQAQLSEASEIIEPVSPKPALKGPTVVQRQEIVRPDLREEVIDPSFDFEAPKPEFEDF